MASLRGLGFTGGQLPKQDGEHVAHVLRRYPLHRIFAFLGRSIDDVIDDPIARNQVRGYFKLYKQIERSGEVTELEKQWNSLGR